jgi:hypothetical protein
MPFSFRYLENSENFNVDEKRWRKNYLDVERRLIGICPRDIFSLVVLNTRYKFIMLNLNANRL